MPEPVEITLKYEGKDVANGTMSVGDVVIALQGFAGAYGKVASAIDPKSEHEIRVSQINKSSFAVVVEAWIQGHKDLLKASSAAVPIVAGIIIKLIEFKKKNKGREPTLQINGDHNIVLMGEGNTHVVMPIELHKTIQSKSLDSDFEKIVRPLETQKIDRAELTSNDREGHIERTEISASEKQYFQAESTATTTSKPTEIIGQMVSLNKESNRGTFRMQNGTSVKYHLVGSDPSPMYHAFAHKGIVRVACTATFDDNLVPQSLEITSIERLQLPLAFSGDTINTTDSTQS